MNRTAARARWHRRPDTGISQPEEGTMNDRARFMRRPRRARPPISRTTTAMIAAAVALLAAGCGGGPSSAGSGGSPAAGWSAGPTSAVAYSHCVRGHGVPSYPDPGGGGTLPKVGA